MILYDVYWRIFLPNEWPQDGSIFDHSRFKCEFHESNQWSGSGQIAISETAGPHVHLEYIIAWTSMFFHSSSKELRTKLRVWGKCHHQMGAPYGFCRFWIWIPYWLWSLPKPLQGSKAVGPQQLRRCAKPSSFWPQNVELRERQLHNLRPRVCTCNIRRRLSTFDIVLFSSCHHDTSNVLTNSTEISWCHVLFWKNLSKNTQVRIQYPVICPVSWVKLYPQSPHLATTLVSCPTATHHLGNKLRPVAPRHLLLVGRSEETLEPGLLHLTSVVHSQITIFNEWIC